MTKLRALLVGAVIAALAGGYVLAQQLTSQTLTGLESWSVGTGGPGGPSIFVTSGQMRGSQGTQLSALTTGSITIPNTTATFITTAVVSGALAVTMPPAPWDGEIFELVNGSSGANTATVTITANTGQTVQGGAIATQAQNASNEWRFALSTLTWYKLR